MPRPKLPRRAPVPDSKKPRRLMVGKPSIPTSSHLDLPSPMQSSVAKLSVDRHFTVQRASQAEGLHQLPEYCRGLHTPGRIRHFPPQLPEQKCEKSPASTCPTQASSSCNARTTVQKTSRRPSCPLSFPFFPMSSKAPITAKAKRGDFRKLSSGRPSLSL